MNRGRFRNLALTAALAFSVWVPAVLAVQPDEVLPDPALESRAREIGKVLRCPVCQGENIDESNAPVSRDLRLYVRERLVAGDSDEKVVDAVTQRFGEYVLFQPRAQGSTLILYFAGPIMAVLAALGAWLFLRRRRAAPDTPPVALNDSERRRLSELMDRQDN